MKHQYGQHYTPELITSKYKDVLLDIELKGRIVVDPFVGEGNLLLDYLSFFSNDKAIELLKNKRVVGYDIDIKSLERVKSIFKKKYNLEESLLDEIFIKKNSLNRNVCKKEHFILTNPPYLARNVCKKSFPKDYKKIFSKNNFSDYYELALDMYSKNEGIWIVPSNVLSSFKMESIRRKLLKKFAIKNINLFQTPIFKDTRISVTSFYLEWDKNIQKTLDINFIDINKESLKKIDIKSNGKICNEWIELTKEKEEVVKLGLLRKEIQSGENEITLLNENYQKETLYVNDTTYEMLKNNCLILRTTDTGSTDGRIGIYSIFELYEDSESKSLITKNTSRLCVPIFFKEEISIEKQLIIKQEINKELEHYRKKYNSIFLTSFKNATQENPRKRISFKDFYGLLNNTLKKLDF